MGRGGYLGGSTIMSGFWGAVRGIGTHFGTKINVNEIHRAKANKVKPSKPAQPLSKRDLRLAIIANFGSFSEYRKALVLNPKLAQKWGMTMDGSATPKPAKREQRPRKSSRVRPKSHSAKSKS